MTEPIMLDVRISEQYDVIVSGGEDIGTATDSRIVINRIEADEYAGPYEITPSATEQVLETRNKKAIQDIIINPIPSNYGLVTWDGVSLTIS